VKGEGIQQLKCPPWPSPKTGSMAKAAKQLAISQPVVSRAIADLESTFGVRLFDRSPQGVEPTLYGRALLKRSLTIFDDLRTSANEIEYLADPTTGELRIGVTEPQAALVAAIIKRMSREHPRVTFDVGLADTHTLIDRYLRERRIDLVVMLLPPTVEEDLEPTVFFLNRLRVVVDRRTHWARSRNVTLADLIDEPWCAPRLDTVAGAAFVGAFRASGLNPPRIIVTTISSRLRNELVADAGFIVTMGDGELFFYAKRLPIKGLPLALPTEPRPIGMVTLKNRTITPAAQIYPNKRPSGPVASGPGPSALMHRRNLGVRNR